MIMAIFPWILLVAFLFTCLLIHIYTKGGREDHQPKTASGCCLHTKKRSSINNS